MLIDQGNSRRRRILAGANALFDEPHFDFPATGARIFSLVYSVCSIGSINSTVRIALERLGVQYTVVIHYEEGAVARTSQGDICMMRSLELFEEEIQGAVVTGDALAAVFLHGVHEELPTEQALY